MNEKEMRFGMYARSTDFIPEWIKYCRNTF